jgi:hypothetical protein
VSGAAWQLTFSLEAGSRREITQIG